MAVIETKFGIGDRVWVAGRTAEKRQHPCPDCLGSRKWEARSPAGGVFEVACPRCGGGYQSNRSLSLDYHAYVPTAQQMTIGQVRAFAGTDDETEYMCRETGIGSGSLWRESVMFSSKDEAIAAAQAECDRLNADADHWVAKQYSESVKFSDYELKDASIKAAESREWDMGWKVRELLNELDDCETLSAVKTRIEEWRGDA